MYGMVNKAIEDLVCSSFGADKWEQIKAKAGVEEEMFLSQEGYPDSMTYGLVRAASEVLGLPAEKILHAFGRHWILKTAREGYGDLLAASGRTRAQIDACVARPEIQTFLEAEISAGAATGITGTPAFFVNGRRVADRSLGGLEMAIRAAEGG